MKKRMLITGVNGLLGNNLTNYFRFKYEVLGIYFTHPINCLGSVEVLKNRGLFIIGQSTTEEMSSTLRAAWIKKGLDVAVFDWLQKCVESSPDQKIFERKGFFARGSVPVICYKNKFSDKFETCNSWHFTMGDSDNI